MCVDVCVDGREQSVRGVCERHGDSAAIPCPGISDSLRARAIARRSDRNSVEPSEAERPAVCVVTHVLLRPSPRSLSTSFLKVPNRTVVQW